MYLYGGANASGPLNDLFCYEEADQKWKHLVGTGDTLPPTEMHTAHVWHSEEEDKTKLLVVGGRFVIKPKALITGECDPFGYSSIIYSYDVEDNEWSTYAALATPLCSHACTLIKNRYLILYGGFSSISIYKNILRYDLETKQVRTFVKDIETDFLKDGRLATQMENVEDEVVVLYGGSGIAEDHGDALVLKVSDLEDDANFVEITEIM